MRCLQVNGYRLNTSHQEKIWKSSGNTSRHRMTWLECVFQQQSISIYIYYNIIYIYIFTFQSCSVFFNFRNGPAMSSIQCLECTSLNSSILDQLGNDSMSSIRSAQRIGYSSDSRLSEYVWNVTWIRPAKWKKDKKGTNNCGLQITSTNSHPEKQWLLVARIWTDIQPMFRDILHSMTLIDSPYTPIISNHLRSSPIHSHPPSRTPGAVQNPCSWAPGWYSVDAAASLQSVWSPRPLAQAPQPSGAGHRERRAHGDGDDGGDGFHAASRGESEGVNKRSSQYKVEFEAKHGKATLRWGFMQSCHVLSRVAKFPSNLTVKED